MVHADAIQKNYADLIQNLETDELVDWLHQEGVLRQYYMEQVKAKQLPNEKRALLLQIISRGSDKNFKTFLVGLCLHDQQHIAVQIDPEVEAEGMFVKINSKDNLSDLKVCIDVKYHVIYKYYIIMGYAEIYFV